MVGFGYGLGDIVLVSQLVSRLITQIKNAPPYFHEFLGDLELAGTVFEEFQSNWNTYQQRALDLGPQENHTATLRNMNAGTRGVLFELQRQINRHNEVQTGFIHTFANQRFARHLEDLRRQLQFHMGSFRLIMQSLRQGNRIGEDVGMIREAQMEQEREEAQEQANREDIQKPNKIEWQDITSPPVQMSGPPGEGSSAGRAPPASIASSTPSRDELVDQWSRYAEANGSRFTSIAPAISRSHLSTTAVCWIMLLYVAGLAFSITGFVQVSRGNPTISLVFQ